MNPRDLDLVLTFIQQHPEAAARELELQPQEVAAELVSALPLKQARQLITHMLPPYVARLCIHWSLDKAAGLMADFNANQAAAILRCIEKPRRDELVSVLPEKISTLCRLLMSYSEDTVGAWMIADLIVLPSTCRVGEALKRFSSAGDGVRVAELLIVNETQHLIGTISVQALLQAKDEAPISHLILPAPPVLHARTSLVAACRHEGWQKNDTLAVLNRNQQLIGILRHLDLRRSLAQHGEVSRSISQNDLIGSLTEAYAGTLMALLSLVGWSSDSVSSRGESR